MAISICAALWNDGIVEQWNEVEFGNGNVEFGIRN